VKHISEYRDGKLSAPIIDSMRRTLDGRRVTFMEVCGTHTMSIYRYGIKWMLPENVNLLSGPGCPVCVTGNAYIDRAVAYSRREDVIVTSFGDMMRVPGSSSSLERERAEGRDIRVVYSTLEALDVARENPAKKVVFLGVGFETTVPTIAASILAAQTEGLKNFLVSGANKTVPEALAAIATGELKLNGFLGPAHVSTIIGAEPYRFLPRDHGLGVVIAGFEPLDVLHAIAMLCKQVAEDRPDVELQYSRIAREDGNPKAREITNRVFEACDADWRGIGVIPASGLTMRENFAAFDADRVIDVEVEATREHKGCICGNILQGLAQPEECKLFGKACTPESPVGACMVSSEGTCAAHFKYGPSGGHRGDQV
jgi:hydrogenase expression/formation protein HypD